MLGVEEGDTGGHSASCGGACGGGACCWWLQVIGVEGHVAGEYWC